MRSWLPALSIAAVVLMPAGPAGFQSAQEPRPVRTFQQFVGTWILDEAASTGRLRITPRIAATLVIETTGTEIIVTKRLRLSPGDRASATPPPEVYRLDGIESSPRDERSGMPLDRTHRFTLAADMLVLTIREGGPMPGRGFTQVTDAYAVEGDVLTVHRQLTSMTAAGEILVMQEPTNNFRHTFVYRRAAPER